MCKSIKERRLENEELDDTPTVRVLYDIILEMGKKMSQMERKMNDLSKWADVKRRKLDMITWLNKHMCGSVRPYDDFLGTIRVDRKHLEYLFKTDYTSGIMNVIKGVLPVADAIANTDADANCVKAFMQKPNVLYVYVPGAGEKGWSVLADKSLQKLINIVTKQLLDEFIKWQTENSDKMEQDDFAIKYAANVIKMMGGNMSREDVYNRIKLDLYKYLKVNVQNMTEVMIE
jgi:hypothetical protein